MDLISIWDLIVNYAKENPKNFWIIVGILLILFFILKPKKENSESTLGMNFFELELFKRQNK